MQAVKTKRFGEALYWTKVIALGTILGVGIQFVQAFTPRPADPPNGNVSGPLTTSSVGQVKEGNLILNATPGLANGLIVANGKVGIGDITPDGTLKVDVEGNVGASAYCDKNGFNCATPPFVTTASVPRKSYSVLVSNSTMHNLHSSCNVGSSGVDGLGSPGEVVACGTACNRYCKNVCVGSPLPANCLATVNSGLNYAAGLLNGMTTSDSGCTCFD